MSASLSPWVWLALAGLVATTVKALVEVLLTRMKLAFALKLLQPRNGGNDAEAARKDLDAVRRFMAPPPGRSVERTRWSRLRPRRRPGTRGPPAEGDLDDANEGSTAA
jgi:hypothetical protein